MDERGPLTKQRHKLQVGSGEVPPIPRGLEPHEETRLVGTVEGTGLVHEQRPHVEGDGGHDVDGLPPHPALAYAEDRHQEHHHKGQSHDDAKHDQAVVSAGVRRGQEGAAGTLHVPNGAVVVAGRRLRRRTAHHEGREVEGRRDAFRRSGYCRLTEVDGERTRWMGTGAQLGELRFAPGLC